MLFKTTNIRVGAHNCQFHQGVVIVYCVVFKGDLEAGVLGDGI